LLLATALWASAPPIWREEDAREGGRGGGKWRGSKMVSGGGSTKMARERGRNCKPFGE